MTGITAAEAWSNWARNVRATPRVVLTLASLEELRKTMIAAGQGETVRVAGAEHSFAPLCATNGTLLDLSLFTGVERVDPATGAATIRAGTRIADLGQPSLSATRIAYDSCDLGLLSPVRTSPAPSPTSGVHSPPVKHPARTSTGAWSEVSDRQFGGAAIRLCRLTRKMVTRPTKAKAPQVTA